MRKLTVLRRKTFAACFTKMKVYIEEPIFGDTVISGVKCRRIGELKNGEAKTYGVAEGERKIFVLSDAIDPEQWNEYYTVPAGTDDVLISGKNNCNPFEGNLFRFDGNDTEEVVKARRKSNLFWWGVCGATAIAGFLLALIIVAIIT